MQNETTAVETVQTAIDTLENWKTKNPGAPLCVACGNWIDFFGSATSPQEILNAIKNEYRFMDVSEAAEYVLRADLSEYTIH